MVRLYIIFGAGLVGLVGSLLVLCFPQALITLNATLTEAHGNMENAMLKRNAVRKFGGIFILALSLGFLIYFFVARYPIILGIGLFGLASSLLILFFPQALITLSESLTKTRNTLEGVILKKNNIRIFWGVGILALSLWLIIYFFVASY